MFTNSATTVTGEYKSVKEAARAINALTRSFGACRISLNESDAIMEHGLAVQVAAGHLGQQAKTLLERTGAIAVSTRPSRMAFRPFMQYRSAGTSSERGQA